MSKKTMVRTAVAAAAAAVLLLGVWVYSREGPLSRGVYDRIQLGMTEEEVDAMLPRLPLQPIFPGGSHTVARQRDEAIDWNRCGGMVVKELPDFVAEWHDADTGLHIMKHRGWEDDRYWLDLDFDAKGRVISKWLREKEYPPDSSPFASKVWSLMRRLF